MILKRIFALAAAFCAVLVLTAAASAVGTNNPVFKSYISRHPEYGYAAFIDMNGDGTDEMVLTDTVMPERVNARLCILTDGGRDMVDVKIYSHYSPLLYWQENGVLAWDTGGTGAYAIGSLSLYGTELFQNIVGREIKYSGNSEHTEYYYKMADIELDGYHGGTIIAGQTGFKSYRDDVSWYLICENEYNMMMEDYNNYRYYSPLRFEAIR